MLEASRWRDKERRRLKEGRDEIKTRPRLVAVLFACAPPPTRLSVSAWMIEYDADLVSERSLTHARAGKEIIELEGEGRMRRTGEEGARQRVTHRSTEVLKSFCVHT